VKATVLDEPELEFRAGNRHVDPRYGVANFGPADADDETAQRKITVGLVGPADGVDGVRRWLERCRSPIAGKKARRAGQENMWPSFPGFAADTGYLAELVFDDALVRIIPDREMRRLASSGPSAIAEASELYFEGARSLADTGRCRVIVCARPDRLEDEQGDNDERKGDGNDEVEVADTEPVEPGADFHDLLKAKALALAAPLQVIRRETWEGKLPVGVKRNRPLQDEATRAWNILTAIYYKGGGTPWRLPRRTTDYDSCFVGVSFYRTPDNEQIHTSVAQVFNERGDGVVVRGGAAAVSKADRQVHLTRVDARDLLLNAFAEYKRCHGNLPARVVIHKTSAFDSSELDGLQEAADSKEVDRLELIWVQRRGAPHLFRLGQLPPLRGTVLELQDDAAVVYTRGSVHYFRTYPGMYVPAPLLIRSAGGKIDLIGAATDVLGLSKMNWNNAQVDERDPLTLRTAESVGHILKHVPPESRIQTRYAYYM
jgi:hypothetical protein